LEASASAGDLDQFFKQGRAEPEVPVLLFESDAEGTAVTDFFEIYESKIGTSCDLPEAVRTNRESDSLADSL
jgi:hypothetical protein